MESAVDAELVAAARGGDSRAFGRLVDAHQQAVRAFLRRLCANHAEADDLSQEAFARAWEVLHRFEGRGSFRAFVSGIAFQYWRRGRRAGSRRLAREAQYQALADTDASHAGAVEARLTLQRAMAALSPDQRAALALCLGAEFSHDEAATALGLPLGTVKSHVARGRARLLAALGEKGDGHG